MYKRFAVTGLALLSFAFAGSAHGAEDSGAYVGLGIGDATLQIDDIGFDESASGWQLFGGYRFNRYFSAEVAWLDVKELTSDIGNAHIEIDGEALIPALLATLPLGDRFSLYGRLGYSLTKTTSKVEQDGQLFIESEDEDDLAYGAGAMVNVAKHFSLRLDYQVLTVGDDVVIVSLGALYRF